MGKFVLISWRKYCSTKFTLIVVVFFLIFAHDQQSFGCHLDFTNFFTLTFWHNAAPVLQLAWLILVDLQYLYYSVFDVLIC